jgi:putative ATP-dependent endonuclease of the OLD family
MPWPFLLLVCLSFIRGILVRLVSYSVENYRSITKAHRLSIGQTTVLVGPNNEGKSNLLKALVAAMDILTARPIFIGTLRTGGSYITSARRRSERYKWKDDFPISLQSIKPKGESSFELEFELDEGEIADFKKEIRSSLNGTLPLRISIGRDTSSIVVRKKGPGGKTLTAKSAKIAAFVSKRVQFKHIPAIRTATLADEVVAPMVSKELESVETLPEYIAAVEQIAKLQEPVLEQLASSVKSIMKTFLPDLKSIKFEIAAETRYRALRRARMILDDGSPTYLEYKGDGVQSLAALALMRHASETGAVGRNLIIAVEEPESHLHPEATHALKTVLQQLSARHQVVVSTHCPVFVERANVGANIIVHRQKARPAKSIAEIREILGVRAADNLRHADVILVVEGEDDARSLKAILASASPKLRSALTNNALAIESLGGGGNLSYKLTYLRNAICLLHCFLDHDRAGIESVQKCLKEGVLSEADYHFATCPDRQESEIEDLFDVQLYRDDFLKSYGISVDHPKFKGKRKWSERMREVFLNQGKSWDDRVEMILKNRLAESVAQNPDAAIHVQRRGPIDSLVRVLLQKLRVQPEKVSSLLTVEATTPGTATSLAAQGEDATANNS